MEDLGRTAAALTARGAGLVGCRSCGLASPAGTTTCARCGAGISPVSTESLQAVWAWLLAGIAFYLPANIYPMLRTTLLGSTVDNTIIGGAIDLANHGNYGVAFIVFVASVVIPVGKFLVIAWLAFRVRRDAGKTEFRRTRNLHARGRLYEVVDFIGRWSMIDVFVVAILAALIQMNFLATIKPGIAAVSFCASVVLTMLAAQAFDSRLIWMNEGNRRA